MLLYTTSCHRMAIQHGAERKRRDAWTRTVGHANAEIRTSADTRAHSHTNMHALKLSCANADADAHSLTCPLEHTQEMDGPWRPYDMAFSLQLERLFLDGPSPVTSATTADGRHSVDVRRAVQTNTTTKFERKVQWAQIPGGFVPTGQRVCQLVGWLAG